MSENIVYTDDYVVETGISNDWTYRKWNSGIAECWKTIEQAVQGDFQAWGNLYRMSEPEPIPRQDYPFAFTERATLNVTLDKYDSTAVIWLIPYRFADGTTQTPGFTVACPNDVSSSTHKMVIHYYAIGKWK